MPLQLYQRLNWWTPPRPKWVADTNLSFRPNGYRCLRVGKDEPMLLWRSCWITQWGNMRIYTRPQLEKFPFYPFQLGHRSYFGFAHRNTGIYILSNTWLNHSKVVEMFSATQISMYNSHLHFQLAYGNTHWRCDIIIPADRILTREGSIYTCI